MRKAVLSIVALLAFVSLADAHYNGYVSPSGYVYNDGYWYWEGVPYSRTWTDGYYQTYYYCGYPYQRYVNGYYSYSRASVPAKISYNTPNWRSELIKLAAARDKQVLESQGFAEAVNVLGLAGNFHVANYGSYSYYPKASYFNNAFVGSYGVNGNTLYGFRATADLYGSTDLNALYQQAYRLGEHSLNAGQTATTNFQALAGQAGENAARVAEISEKGKVALAIMATVRPEPRAQGTVQTYSSIQGNAKPGTYQPQAATPNPAVDLSQRWAALVTARCSSCHTGADARGKFDITAMTPEQRLKAIDLVLKGDMPRDSKDETKPGQPLDDGEQLLFFRGSKR